MSVPKIKYDFTDLENICADILEDPSYTNLRNLKNELNKFFKDSTCKDIIYTKNTDKLFFGMSVIPTIDDGMVADIVNDENSVRFDAYYIEIDSKLLEPTLNLTPKELTAVLLHEVGHMVKDDQPVQEVRKCIDVYMLKNNDHIVLNDSVNYREILRYGIVSTLRKITSIFERKDDEIIADEFVFACGYGMELSDALKKISKNGFLINKNVKDKMIVLSWVLRLYKEVKFRRIPALRTLKKGEDMTASKLEIKQMQKVEDSLKRIDDSSLLEASGFVDSVKQKISETRKSVTYRGIKEFENDLYEYSVRVKNLYDEEDALVLLRTLNTRISILNDYVTNEEMPERERERWYKILDQYYKVRDELSKKKLYKYDYRSPIIQVNYPDIVDNRR